MPRKKSSNVFQVAFKIPRQWVRRADSRVEYLRKLGIATTRTDVLRAWLQLGMLETPHITRGRATENY